MTSTHIAPSPLVEGSFATVRAAQPAVAAEPAEAVQAEVVAVVEQAVVVVEAGAVVVIEQAIVAPAEVSEEAEAETVAEVPAQRRNRHEERDMQVALADFLTTQGWEVTREHLLPSGAKVDIVATRPGFAPFVIECKLKLASTGLSNRAFTQLNDQLGQIGRLGVRKSPIGVLVALEIDHEAIESVRETNRDVMMWTEKGFRRYVRSLSAQAV